jgi:hypothetical protein
MFLLKPIYVFPKTLPKTVGQKPEKHLNPTKTQKPVPVRLFKFGEKYYASSKAPYMTLRGAGHAS